MTELTHAVRLNPLDKERIFSLGEDALHWREAGATRSLPYADIAELRLFKHGIGQLSVQDRGGTRIKLRSHHCRGLGSFENRATSYVPFVRELCRRVGAANPQAKFIAGSTAFWLFWLAVLLTCALNAALFALPLFFGALVYAIPLLVLLAIAFVMWRTLPSNRETAFDPADPPADALDLQSPFGSSG